MNQIITSLHFKFRMSMVAILLVAMPIHTTYGQDKPEPSVIIAAAPVDEQLNDVEYMAGAMSETFGQMSGLIRLQAKGFLKGIDFSKPAGALLYFEAGKVEPNAIGFVPMSNLDDFLDQISNYAEIEENDDTEVIKILPDNGDDFSLINKNGYAFVSDVPEMLKNVPADPAAMIGELSKTYNFAAKIFPQRVPQEMKDMAMDWIEENYQMSLDQMDELQADIQEAQFDMQMKQIEMLIQDLDVITMGFIADKDKESMVFDFKMKGVSDSEFQKRIAASNVEAGSMFTGFLVDNAALTFHNCSGMSEDDVKIYSESMDNMRSTLLERVEEEAEESEIELAKKLSGKLVDVMKNTLKSGVLDMGGVAYTDDGLNIVAAAKIIGASDLESSIKEIVAEAESKLEDDQVVFNLNSGSHSGFNLHEIMVTLDQDEIDENAIELLGEQVKIILGISKNQVYVAAGKNPEPSLKKSIDANSGGPKKTDIIGQYNIYIKPIMKLVAEMEPQEQIEMMRDKIEEVGKDRIQVTWNVVDGEVRGQAVIQDGIFAMLGAMAEAMSGMGGGGADF